jgi:hypothetical protein
VILRNHFAQAATIGAAKVAEPPPGEGLKRNYSH